MIQQLLRQLEEAARQGQQEIDDGDWARPQLKDSTFSEIVPLEHEDDVIEAMVQSDLWWRTPSGFRFKLEFDETHSKAA